MFQVRGVFRIFLTERAKNFDIFEGQFFSKRDNLKQIEKQIWFLKGPGACSPGKFLKVSMMQWPF